MQWLTISQPNKTAKTFLKRVAVSQRTNQANSARCLIGASDARVSCLSGLHVDGDVGSVSAVRDRKMAALAPIVTLLPSTRHTSNRPLSDKAAHRFSAEPAILTCLLLHAIAALMYGAAFATAMWSL